MNMGSDHRQKPFDYRLNLLVALSCAFGVVWVFRAVADFLEALRQGGLFDLNRSGQSFGLARFFARMRQLKIENLALHFLYRCFHSSAY